MPSETHVEWIDGEKGERLFRKRRAAAIAKVREMYPDRPDEDIVPPVEMDSVWDWVEFEECTETRRFPNVAMAMGWGARNHRLDAFSAPRIYRNEWREGEPEAETVTTHSLQYEDGVWLDTDKGIPYVAEKKASRGASAPSARDGGRR